jgi:hypothetical protein
MGAADLFVSRQGRSLGSPYPIHDVGSRMLGLPYIMYTTYNDNDKLRLALLKNIVLCFLFRSMWQVI